MDIATLGIKVESDGVTKASDRLDDLAMKAAQAAAAILSIGAAADAWVKFDSATRAAANLTGAALEDVKRMANDVGVAMGKFSGDVATAAGQVGSFAPALLSNLPALQSVTEASLTLAEAAKATGDAMTDTQGAQAITAALNQWGVSADDAIVKSREFANVLAAGAKEGSASVSNIVAAMANAGTTAASAKIKFEEFTGAIETMAEKQLLGAEAGTALRNMIAKLSTSDSVFKEMGISGVSATLATEGLQAALQKLAPISQNNTLLVKAFGQENLNASQILIQNAGRIGEFTAKITGTSTAYEQAQAGLATFSRQVEIFGAMLQNIGALAIDSIISPVAAPALQQVNEILKEVFGELQAFNDSDMPAAIRYEFELWGDNLSNLIPLIDAITSGWIMAYDAVNQIPLALDLIDGQIDSVSSKTTLADIFIYAYEQVMNLPSAITVFGAMAAAEFEAVKQSLIAVWLDGKSFAAEMFRSIGNWINITAESIANMQKGFATAIRDFADGAAQLAVSADAVAGTNLSSKVMAARDAAAAWAIETIQGSKAAKAATIEYNSVVDQQIAGYQAQKEGGEIAVKNARAAAELAIKQNDAAISADRLSRENAKLARENQRTEKETSKAIDAIEKENAALMGVKEKTDKASTGMATLADKSKKAAGEISLTADEILAASDSLIDFEKIAQAGIDAVNELNEAQQGKLFDLEKEIQYLSIADEKERERLKYLDEFSGEYRDQAAALYDQKQAVLEQNSAWESVKSGAMSFFDEVIKTGEFSFKKLWTSFKGLAFKSLMDSLTSGKGILSNLSGAWSSLSGMFSGGGSSGAAAAGGGGGRFGSLGGIGSLASGASSIAGMFGGGGGLLGGLGSSLGSLGGLASMASAAMPIIGGIMAIPQIGKLLTGTWGTKGLFASGDVMAGDFDIGRTREKKGLLGKKSKRETFDPNKGGFEDVRDALEGTWSTLDNFKGEMLKLAGGIGQAFGKDITGEFQNQFKATLNIDASGEEFSKQLNKWLSDTTGAALKTALDLALAGDASQFANTIRELTSAAGEDVSQVTALVNGLFSLKAQMSVLTLDTELLTPALISASGGIEQLQGSLNFFYEQFYTDTERATAQLDAANKSLADGFAELGLTVPATRAEFRALVEGLKSTETGADSTLAELLKLANSADLVYDAAESAAPEVEDVAGKLNDLSTAAKDAGNGLNEFQNTYMNQAGALPQMSEDAYNALVYGLVPAIEETKETALQATEDLSKAFLKWRDGFGLLSPLQQAQEWVMGLGISADEFAATVRGVSWQDFQGIASGLGVTTDELMQAVDQTYGDLKGLEKGVSDLGNTAASAGRSLADIDRELSGALDSFAGGALDSLRKSVDAEKNARQEAYNATKDAIDAGLDKELAAMESAHQWRLDSIEAEKEAAQENAQRLRGIADSLKNAIESVGIQSEATELAARRSAQAQLRQWAAGNGLPNQAELDKAISAVSGDSKQFFGSFTDYARDAARTAGDMGTLAARAETQATAAEQTIIALTGMAEAENAQFEASQAAAQLRHDQAIELATAQYEADIAGLEQQYTDAEMQLNRLLGIETATLTVADAVNGVQTALGLYSEAIAGGLQIKQDENAALKGQIDSLIAERAAAVYESTPQTEIMPGIMTTAAAAVEDVPGFASGGMHAGGLAVVGEEGAELVDLPPARIHSNKASGLAFDELIAELRQLREDLNAAQYQIAKNTGKSVKLMELWNGDGLPETRTL